MTRIVSVVNQKGGVAKTTSTANIGACLAQHGSRTLLIDLDPQANLTLGLRQEWEEMPYGLQHTIVDRLKAPMVGIVRRVGELPLYLAPGHVDMARAEAALVRRDETAYNLRNALADMLESYPFDWILIDCPPSLGILTQNAIVASTHLLVPTEPKMYAFAGMDTLNKMVSGLSRDYQFEIKLLGVLLTMVERQTRLHRTAAALIQERFGDKVFRSVVHKNVRLSEAEIEGKPIIEYDRRAAGAREYAAVTEEILERVAAEADSRPQPARVS